MSEPERQATRFGDGRMSLFEHLEELRRRLIYASAFLLVATIVCFGFAPTLFEWLRHPLAALSDQKLAVLSPLEMFITYLKLAFLAGLCLSAPWVLLQIWLFVAPGLYRHEKRWVVPFVVCGTVFFVGGALFAFYVVLPFGFRYLLTLVPKSVEAMYSVEVYFSLVVHLMLAFGIVFELPLIMTVLGAAGVVSHESFVRFRKYWIVLAFIVGGVLTPPDPFTQLFLAVPLVLFYELGILGARLLRRHFAAGRAVREQARSA